MSARYYESNTSGMNFDRFLDRFDESTVVTMKRHFWTAKQLLRNKMGKKEDEHLLASDAELDSKLTLFRSLRDTSENLLACIENYQSHLLDATLIENELGKYLKEQGKKETRDETARVMVAVGRALLFSSHQRAAVRQPLVRFYQELHVFTERAIGDCAVTVEAVEGARTRYRGSLLWIKNTSEELDPDTDRQLEKFREAQAAVRTNKERLDRLKTDTMQKVDLLSASRSNLLCHLLGKYLQLLGSYFEKTGRAYSALADNLSVFQHYEFEILTDLIEPSRRVAKKVRQESIDKKESAEKERREMERSASLTAEEPNHVGDLVNLSDDVDVSLNEYLFGRASPVLRDSTVDEERPDSPLGILDEGEEAMERTPEKLSISIGPLPASSLLEFSAEVPRLAPPPGPSSTARPINSVGPSTSSEGFTSHPLFPVVKQKQGDSIMDLLNFNQPDNKFPNPFNESKNNEWDLLLSQCDSQQQSDDLL